MATGKRASLSHPCPRNGIWGKSRIGSGAGWGSPDGAHAPWVDGTPGARDAVARTASEVAAMLDRDRRQGFAWLTREGNRQQAKTGTEPYYLPRYGIILLRRVPVTAICCADSRSTSQRKLY